MGAAIFEPKDASRNPSDASGKRIGLFLLHGGSADHRSQGPAARLLAGKFGYKVVTMTYPGRLYLAHQSRDWPGDTIHPDGSVRTPIWSRDTRITRDQYEIVDDREERRRRRYGTLIFARAKEGTEFYHRMAGWPVAFEEGAKDLMRRHFPADEYSIYIHGHSTGGIFADALSQRVENITGVLAMESSPFGYIHIRRMEGVTWDLPFNYLRIRTWRDKARYMGPEALAQEGPEALRRLPMLMEEVFESWEKTKTLPQFKAENVIHYNATESLTQAALVTAQRLKMSDAETKALVDKYVGYTRELSGDGVKPVPPHLIGFSKTSSGYTRDIYDRIILPAYAMMNPPAKVHVVSFEAGTHSFSRSEPGLPLGILPAVASLWRDAIAQGYFHKR
jgi:hypothetical protein